MAKWKYVSLLDLITPLLLVLGACSESKHTEPPGGWAGVCVDYDGDGYGLDCDPGDDCNDSNPSIHVGCGACDTPSEGCYCVAGSAPVTCTLAPGLSRSGSLLCNEGTRYCRDEKWSACEGIRSYEAPAATQLRGVKFQGLLQDAGTCGDGTCRPDCWAVSAAPTVSDAGTSTVVAHPGGGITIVGQLAEGGIIEDPDRLTPPGACDVAHDADCDNIPDDIDDDPTSSPFDSDHGTIFMDLEPGQTKATTFDIRFALKNADVYFLLDMSNSMEDEKQKLISSLQTGNFLDDPSTAANEANENCQDRDYDGSPDNDLKTKGIAGNIACMIRGAQIGAGFFREIPFGSKVSDVMRYGWPNYEVFEHRLDVTSDVSQLASALNLFYAGRENQNWAESSAIALSLVASGGPLYTGWDRPGVPQKTCPSGRFGYPCFRSDAMPIVVLITDAPMMNGPTPTTQSHLGKHIPPGHTYYAYATSQPVNYDNAGLKYLSKSSTDAVYYPLSGNESVETAYNVGTIDSTFKTYTGDTRAMAADLHAANLGTTLTDWPSGASSSTAKGYPDALFKFTVSASATSKDLTISTRGTRFKPTLAIIPMPTVVAAGTNPTSALAKDLGSIGSTTINQWIHGDTTPAAFDTGEADFAMLAEAFRGATDANSTDTAPDAWFKFTVPSNTTGVTFAATGSDFDAVLGLYAGAPPTTQIVDLSMSPYSNSNDKHTQAASVLPTGTTASPGVLDGRSLLFRSGNTNVGTLADDYAADRFTGATTQNCSGTGGVSGKSKDAVIDFKLGATKTVRIETLGATDVRAAAAFDHALGLFTRPTSAGTAFADAGRWACNRNGVATQRALIEQSLNAGTYSTVVRGRTSSNTGTYGVLVSDAAARPLGWHNSLSASSFTVDLKSGVTYYLVMRGRSTSQGDGRGPYNIRISKGITGWSAYDNTSKTEDSVTTSPGAAEIVRKFTTAGDYLAIIKGNSSIEAVTPATDIGRGWYQITFGDATKTTNNLTMSLPQWGTSTSGIYKQLTDQGIRVITVASVKACNPASSCDRGADDANKALQEQGDIVAKATGAKNTAGNGLRFDVYNDGSGLDNAIVNAVYQLSQGVKQNVSVRFTAAPDTPTAPQEFTFVSRAIHVDGDGCTGVTDCNLDGTADTHLGCTWGAQPRFQVSFGNPPLSDPKRVLPKSPSVPGYNMRIDLIGRPVGSACPAAGATDGVTIDSTPVYLVPYDVEYEEPKYAYSASGEYIQDIGATSCTGTQRPRWGTLSWSASIPSLTSIEWKLCAGDTTQELDSCANSNGWATVANVTTGDSCTTSATCMNGYCAGNMCEYPVLPSSGCSADSDCGNNGKCVAGACRWTANPIDLRPVARLGIDGKTLVRLKAKLNASPDTYYAPTIYSYGLNYTCTNTL